MFWNQITIFSIFSNFNQIYKAVGDALWKFNIIVKLKCWLSSAVKPVKGNALLFFSLRPDATTDPDSLHGSCPVIEGQKWSATKWIHVRSFENPGKNGGSGDGCEDENVLCAQWAAVGECAKNPNYMLGTKEAPGFCRKSCNVCTQ